MAEAGRPTSLSETLFKEIRECILDGKNLRETAETLFSNSAEISKEEKTKGKDNYIQKLYNWNCDNYLNLNDKIEGWRRDRKLKKAEEVLDEMMNMSINTLEWQGRGEDAEQVVVTNPALIKVKQDTAKFIAETLGKVTYSKRSELSGPNGRDLIPVDSEKKVKSDLAIDAYLKQTEVTTNP